MKILNIAAFAVVLFIISLSSVAQARANSWEIISGDSSFMTFAPGNKYCPNAESPMTDAEIDDSIRVHNETRQVVIRGPLSAPPDSA